MKNEEMIISRKKNDDIHRYYPGGDRDVGIIIDRRLPVVNLTMLHKVKVNTFEIKERPYN